jgi:chlorobactene lauroyltransferase
MITARKSALAEAFWYRYFRRKMRHRFRALRVKGSANVPGWHGSTVTTNSPLPVVFIGNHSSWWDAVVPLIFSYGLFRHDAYAMMEEKQLARYRFFRGIGCFSVIREDARSALRSLDYAADLLRGTTRALWMYPQGKIVSVDQRPLRFFSGISRLLHAIHDVSVVPVGFRYEFFGDEAPEILVSFGEPWSMTGQDLPDRNSITTLLEQRVVREMDEQREAVIARNFEGYELLLEGAKSVNERWDSWRRKRAGTSE